jgi:predicted DCC family thiol-disulfide oxidoreductase YuxK
MRTPRLLFADAADRVARLWRGGSRREWLPRRTGLLVFFDGGCGICRPTVSVLQRLDVLERVEFLDVQGDWDIIAQQFPQLTQQACLTEMHGIDPAGRIYVGFDTYRALAWLLPVGWIALPLLYIPPVAWAGRRIFRFVASRRPTTCAIPLRTAPSRAERELTNLSPLSDRPTCAPGSRNGDT